MKLYKYWNAVRKNTNAKFTMYRGGTRKIKNPPYIILDNTSGEVLVEGSYKWVSEQWNKHYSVNATNQMKLKYETMSS
jgi:hypothetical protein